MQSLKVANASYVVVSAFALIVFTQGSSPSNAGERDAPRIGTRTMETDSL